MRVTFCYNWREIHPYSAYKLAQLRPRTIAGTMTITQRQQASDKPSQAGSQHLAASTSRFHGTSGGSSGLVRSRSTACATSFQAACFIAVMCFMLGLCTALGSQALAPSTLTHMDERSSQPDHSNSPHVGQHQHQGQDATPATHGSDAALPELNELVQQLLDSTIEQQTGNIKDFHGALEPEVVAGRVSVSQTPCAGAQAPSRDASSDAAGTAGLSKAEHKLYYNNALLDLSEELLHLADEVQLTAATACQACTGSSIESTRHSVHFAEGPATSAQGFRNEQGQQWPHLQVAAAAIRRFSALLAHNAAAMRAVREEVSAAAGSISGADEDLQQVPAPDAAAQAVGSVAGGAQQSLRQLRQFEFTPRGFPVILSTPLNIIDGVGARGLAQPLAPSVSEQALLQYLCTSSDDQINALASCTNLSRGARVGFP